MQAGLLDELAEAVLHVYFAVHDDADRLEVIQMIDWCDLDLHAERAGTKVARGVEDAVGVLDGKHRLGQLRQKPVEHLPRLKCHGFDDAFGIGRAEDRAVAAHDPSGHAERARDRCGCRQAASGRKDNLNTGLADVVDRLRHPFVDVAFERHDGAVDVEGDEFGHLQAELGEPWQLQCG